MPAPSAYAQEATTVDLPAYTAYAEPDFDAVPISREDVGPWNDAAEQIVWYARFTQAGAPTLRIPFRLRSGSTTTFALEISAQDGSGPAVPAQEHTTSIRSDGQQVVDFGSYRIPRPGYYRIALRGVARSGDTFGSPIGLRIEGLPAGAVFHSHSPERGAPSVHLTYPYPSTAAITTFYDEVTVKSDPLNSYYMATGFGRGYFGIQVNGPNERRIIFSVWNAGNEPTDPNNVPRDDRVQLIAKGDGVVTSEFGNEGTGGHSHLVYDWKTGETYRFAVTAKPDDSATIYSGFFYFPEKQRWGLIASWRAPKDGGFLTHLYSFNEDFEAANGFQRRFAEFGNQWVATAEGGWHELTRARFTHTAEDTDRLDRGAGIAHGNFYLSNGGFIDEPPVKTGDVFTRPPTNAPPHFP